MHCACVYTGDWLGGRRVSAGGRWEGGLHAGGQSSLPLGGDRQLLALEVETGE